jgi:hypothetical protein
VAEERLVEGLDLLHVRQVAVHDHAAGEIELVTPDNVQGLANTFFDTKSIALTVLGNLDGFKITRDRLDCN